MRIFENIVKAANERRGGRGAACCARLGTAVRDQEHEVAGRGFVAGWLMIAKHACRAQHAAPLQIRCRMGDTLPRIRVASFLMLLAIVSFGIASSRGFAATPDECKSCVIAPPPVMPAGSSPCDRECLYGFVEQFFGALGMHNPYGVAMAPEIKYTENGQIVKPGEGMWKTFSRRGTYRVYLADPANGTVGFYGNYSEYNGTLYGVMAMRIKVQDRRITEVEVIVSREELRPMGGLAVNTAGIMTPRLVAELNPKAFVSPDVTLLEPVAAASRTPRDQLVAATQSYFDGVSQGKGSAVAFADKCSRRENGVDVTGNPAGPVADPAQPAFRFFTESCAGEIDRGFFTALTKPRDRRLLVVDEEQGLVLNVAVLDSRGNVKSVAVSGVGNVAVPRVFLRPVSYIQPQLFKIENGKIRQIEGISWAVPYGMRSVWDK